MQKITVVTILRAFISYCFPFQNARDPLFAVSGASSSRSRRAGPTSIRWAFAGPSPMAIRAGRRFFSQGCTCSILEGIEGRTRSWWYSDWSQATDHLRSPDHLWSGSSGGQGNCSASAPGSRDATAAGPRGWRRPQAGLVSLGGAWQDLRLRRGCRVHLFERIGDRPDRKAIGDRIIPARAWRRRTGYRSILSRIRRRTRNRRTRTATGVQPFCFASSALV